MNHFEYRNGELHAEDIPLSRIADRVGTPFYCYSTATLERHFKRFSEAFSGQEAFAERGALICYAVKANSNLAILRILGQRGAGADVVSEGELRRALAAGIPASRIVFSGVGKTVAEMEFALDCGIHQFNVESEPELEALNRIAEARHMRAPVALRVNPDVDARTHEKISTGRKENKFGIELARVLDVYGRATEMKGIEMVGVAVHIGSQLLDLEPFRQAFQRIADLVVELRAAGLAVPRLDLGGGLGVPYAGEDPPTPEAYAAMIGETIGPLECELMLEPGRLLVGNAGVLVASVIYVKRGATRSFVIVDAAMNDLLRPSLYDAYHEILPLVEPAPGSPVEPMDVVGPVCETGDRFAAQRPLPPIAGGELLAFATAGAYSAVMASSYNTRPLIPEVLVKGGDFAVIRARPTYDEILSQDHLPPWLDDRPQARSQGAA